MHSPSETELWSFVDSLLASTNLHPVVTANALLALESLANTALAAACAHASLVLPESSGMGWAFRLLKYPRPYQISGVDFAWELCRRVSVMGGRIYLLGGAPGIAEQAAQKIRAEIPHALIKFRHGYFDAADEPQLLSELQAYRPKLVLVGLGMPRQDIWIHERRERLPPALYVGVGGTFDIWSGRVKRAPILMRKTGFEWLFRWIQEPWRWRRMSKLPVFLLRVTHQRFSR